MEESDSNVRSLGARRDRVDRNTRPLKERVEELERTVVLLIDAVQTTHENVTAITSSLNRLLQLLAAERGKQ